MDVQIVFGQFFMFFCWSIPCIHLPADDMGHKSLKPMIFTLMFYYIFYYTVPMTVLKMKDGYKYGWILKVIGPAAAISLNFNRDGANQETLYGLLAMVCYDLLYMAQGAVDHVWEDELAMWR